MVQKTVHRGRPPKFERDAVIAAATGAFFHSGYQGTTLSDLEKATGVDRSTLYNSFGGKQGLYELATTAYLDRAESWLFDSLANGTTDGYGDILEFLEKLRTGLTATEAIPGCLIVNDMAAGSAPDAARRYRTELKAGLAAALTRAGHPKPRPRADLLTAAVIGVNLVSKMTADPSEIGRHIDAMVATVTDWQTRNT